MISSLGSEGRRARLTGSVQEAETRLTIPQQVISSQSLKKPQPALHFMKSGESKPITTLSCTYRVRTVYLGNFPLREISRKTAPASAENTSCPQMSVLCSIHKDTKISWHFQGVNSHLHFGAWPFHGLTFILHLIGWRGGSTLTSSALPTYSLFSLSLSIKDSALRAAWKTLRGFEASCGHKRAQI